MFIVNKKPVVVGDCEACTKSINVELFPSEGNMLICKACFDVEKAVVKTPAQTLVLADRIDSTLNRATDIFNANIMSNREIYAAILADETIEQDKKETEYTRRIDARRARIQDLQFELKHEDAALQQEKTQSVARMSEAERKKHQNFVVPPARGPLTKGAVKKAAESTQPKKFILNARGMELIKEASVKHGVPTHSIKMAMEGKLFDTPDAAAAHIAHMSAALKSQTTESAK